MSENGTVWCGIHFPENFGNPKFVETVSGAFTLQVDWMGKEPFTEDDRLLLAELTKEVLENKTATIIETYKPKPIKVTGEKDAN